MKLRVGYVQCNEQPVEGSLDQTLIRVMSCSNATNGESVQTVYTNGQTDIMYPKDPVVDILPPPPMLPEDQPAETMEAITPTTTEPGPAATTETGSNNTLLIGGGLLLLFLLLGKNKKRR